MRDAVLSDRLLDWYDQNARVLPWRVSPSDRKAGQKPDPYRVWLSEIMLQQTTVAAVKSYFLDFTSRWPTVQDLAGADDAAVMAAWAGLGYYARARNLLACARIVSGEYRGGFPQTLEGLLALPGVGPYTAGAIAAIAFDLPATVMDGNVERVMARLHGIGTPLPSAKKVLRSHAERHTPKNRPGDYAQAVMDLGATICSPRSPSCGRCPVRSACVAFADGNQGDLPRKTPRKPKPTRFGIAYVARRTDGAWLVETRPDKGLLGGMLGWPGTDWTEERPQDRPPMEADWRTLSEEARHTFTHFHLRLAIKVATAPYDATAKSGEFLDQDRFNASALPTVMRKVHALAAATLRDL